VYWRSASEAVLQTPYFGASVWVFGVAAMGELLVEPAFVVVQQKGRTGIRALAEGVGAVGRCAVTCAVAICAARSGKEVGVLPWAVGQGTFAACLLVVYFLSVRSIASEGGFSLLPKKLYSRYIPFSYFYYQP